MSDNNNDNSISVVVNPYNFNNKLLTELDVKKILIEYGINDNINGLELYQQAYIHKSYSEKLPEDIGENVSIADKPEGALELMPNNYETLEFLGDSVYGLIISKYLYERFPDENEGFLTKMRTKLVNGEMMAYLSRQLDFGQFIIMSRHIEDKCNGRNATHILEDVFEAFIGAMFLDFNKIDNYNLLDKFYSGIGYQLCETFVVNLIEEKIDFSELILLNTNYKEKLMRYYYDKSLGSPTFGEFIVDGGLNDRIFKVDVLHDTTVLAQGIAKTKKKAEQNACKNALDKLF